jgi:hypothetical protein
MLAAVHRHTMKRLLALLAFLPAAAFAGPPDTHDVGVYANFGAYALGLSLIKEGKQAAGCKSLADGIYIAKSFGGIDYSNDVKALNLHCSRY